ncbi:hypothetical protein RBH29_07245 [Herbivorax sp. ANBcel31]|uniref:hypothetical protein n=1 Tax=Herbivorax sp. ANBcel31 TaxID=3069754 RepID=UPI0027ADF44A|nr:hypothetical protein [Herbivorax sp. ANBcel31]MDQ2086223.1 hypothetical protein [Herbivorax sp. ANBcel31]
MNLSENIKNAFNVVRKTYENADKLMKYCDSISNECGYDIVTNKFLRYKSDSDYEGWFIDRFVKLYQQKADKVLENDWRDGPIYAVELNFEDMPIVYISKFEYEDITTWSRGAISPASYWVFSDLIDCTDNEFEEKNLNKQDKYFVSVPKNNNVKNSYWGIKRSVYTNYDLKILNSNNIMQKVFSEFDVLKSL